MPPGHDGGLPFMSYFSMSHAQSAEPSPITLPSYAIFLASRGSRNAMAGLLARRAHRASAFSRLMAQWLLSTCGVASPSWSAVGTQQRVCPRFSLGSLLIRCTMPRLFGNGDAQNHSAAKLSKSTSYYLPLRYILHIFTRSHTTPISLNTSLYVELHFLDRTP